MFVRDIMTTNVVTVSSNTSVVKARKIMDANRLKRLPVVDDNKLVGMVTDRMIDRVSPPERARSVWELTYSLGSIYRTKVGQVMKSDLVTVSPDMTIEEAVSVAQSKKVGALLVLEKGALVGIVTTNDFFYRIVNRVLGVDEPGCRIQIDGGGSGKALEEILGVINKRGMEIITLHVMRQDGETPKDIVVHVDCSKDQADELIAELKEKGYKANTRRR